MMSREERIAADQRRIAGVAWVIAAVAIVGLVVKTAYYPFWVFLLAFSVAAVPRWIWHRIRSRRHSHRRNEHSTEPE